MTEFELLELLSIYFNGLNLIFISFITVLSGYLIVIHYTGKDLSIFQYWYLTITYSILELFMIISYLMVLERWNIVRVHLQRIEVSVDFPSRGGDFSYFFPVVLSIIFIGSLVYSYSKRISE